MTVIYYFLCSFRSASGFSTGYQQSIKVAKSNEKNTLVLLSWMDELTLELCCEFVYTGDFFVPELFLATVTGYAKTSTAGTAM